MVSLWTSRLNSQLETSPSQHPTPKPQHSFFSPKLDYEYHLHKALTSQRLLFLLPFTLKRPGSSFLEQPQSTIKNNIYRSWGFPLSTPEFDQFQSFTIKFEEVEDKALEKLKYYLLFRTSILHWRQEEFHSKLEVMMKPLQFWILKLQLKNCTLNQ